VRSSAGYIEDVKHLPTVENMYLTLIGGAGAIAVHPFDPTLNAHLRSHDPLVNDMWAPAKYYGDTPEQVGLSLGIYAFGRLFDQPKVSHLGMDLIRAQFVAETLVEPLKFATHRLRPDGSNDQSHRPQSPLSKRSMHRRPRPTLTALQTEDDAHTVRVEQLKWDMEIQVKRIARARSHSAILRERRPKAQGRQR